jgi:hypothetical protein
MGGCGVGLRRRRRADPLSGVSRPHSPGVSQTRPIRLPTVGGRAGRKPIGSWDRVYRYARNRVREMDGSERPAKGLEVDLGEDSGPLS